MALRMQAGSDAFNQYRPAIEQAQASPDLHEEGVGWYQTDMAAELVAPGGQLAKQALLGITVARAYFQCRA